LKQLAKKNIEKFFMIKDDSLLEKTFDRFKEKDTGKILESNIKAALKELDINFDNDETVIDSSDEAAFTLEEFKFGISRPSKIEQWTTNIPFAKLIANGLSAIVYHSAKKNDVLAALAECSERNLISIADVLRDGIVRLILVHIKDLKVGYLANQKLNTPSSSPDDQSKFAFGDLKTMSCGNVKDFYAGLGNRVGL
jgi:hypothetical protein